MREEAEAEEARLAFEKEEAERIAAEEALAAAIAAGEEESRIAEL